MAEVAAQGAYISTEQLAQMIETMPANELCILNSTVKPEAECDVFREHANARIPGAKFLDLTLVKDLQSPYPFMMPNKQHFVRMMKSLNVCKSMTVVCYETGKGWFASRAAFMLKSFGHPKVYILDGNFKKWQTEGRAVQSDGRDDTYVSDFDYNLNSDNMLSYQRIKEVSADQSIQIVDNRPPPSIASTGAIPNAINVPGPSMLAADGTIKSAEEIRQVFESKGVDVSKPMAFSCAAGILSSLSYACATKANFPGQLYFYDGSWSEYSAMQSQEAQQ